MCKDSEQQSIGAMIKILSEAIGQKVNRDCRGSNLTMQQMRILHFLKQREGKEETSQKDIQDFMRIAHPTTVNILRLMKEKGFIRISVSEKDRRMKIVTLTGQEDEFVESVIRSRKKLEEQLLDGLTEKERADLLRYLHHIYANVSREDTDAAITANRGR
jgi:DNA-binding MarR family transcriptional regulator